MQSGFTPELTDSAVVGGVYRLHLRSAAMKTRHLGELANFRAFSGSMLRHVLKRRLQPPLITRRSNVIQFAAGFEGVTEGKKRILSGRYCVTQTLSRDEKAMPHSSAAPIISHGQTVCLLQNVNDHNFVKTSFKILWM